MGYKPDLEAMVLAALEKQSAHGYGIVREIRTRSEGLLKLGEGQLYPILHRLEERNVIAGEWELQEGKPPRKVYSLTEDGRRALADRKKEWTKFSSAIGNVFGNSRVQEVN